MRNKITVLVLMLASLIIFLPSEGKAAVREDRSNLNTSATLENAQTRVVIRRPGRRTIVRRGYRRPYYRGVRRPRVVRQVYYRNGRRYVRTVRRY